MNKSQEIINEVRHALKSDNIYLFGSSKDGYEIYNKYKSEWNIICFLSLEKEFSKEEIEFSKKTGIDIKYWMEAISDGDAYFVLCGPNSSRYENLLMSEGYVYYKNIIYTSVLPIICSEKKKILFSGHCQMEELFEFLKQIDSLTEEYDIFLHATNVIPNRWSTRRFALLKNVCDKYVYINTDFVGHDENMLTLAFNSSHNHFTKEEMPDESSVYCIPNLTCMRLYWPTMIQETMNPYYEYFRGQQHWNKRRHAPILYADVILDSLIRDGYQKNDIIKKCIESNFVSEVHVSEHMAYIINCLNHMDDNCDMKIADYIKDNYQATMLYKDADHAQPVLLKEYTKRLLQMLGIEADSEVENVFLPDNMAYAKVNEHCSEVPVYPCVAKKMSLQWYGKSNKYITLLYGGTKLLSLEEYIEKYVDVSIAIKKLQDIW